MLTLKIRVPYKEGKPDEILKEIQSVLTSTDWEVYSFNIEGGTIGIKVANDSEKDLTLDLRLLEIS